SQTRTGNRVRRIPFALISRRCGTALATRSHSLRARFRWLRRPEAPEFPGTDGNRWRNSMVIASNNKTSVLLGLLVCALGISVSSSADARKANRQGTYVEQGYPNPTPGITVMPRNTPKANIVCWTPCGQAGAIVLGADPDPNIRAYLIRDASRYF